MPCARTRSISAAVRPTSAGTWKTLVGVGDGEGEGVGLGVGDPPPPPQEETSNAAMTSQLVRVRILIATF
jgi:hypothetical protein